MTSEASSVAKSGQESVVLASFDSYRPAEHMLASLWRGFPQEVPQGRHDCGRGQGQPRRAALIYMHSSDRRQRTLADAVAKAARAELAKSKKGKAAKPSGTRVARRQSDTSENESGERSRTADLRKYWSPVTESNRRPSPYHGDALPTELTGLVAYRA